MELCAQKPLCASVPGFQGGFRTGSAAGAVQPDCGGDPRGDGGLPGHEVAWVQPFAR